MGLKVRFLGLSRAGVAPWLFSDLPYLREQVVLDHTQRKSGLVGSQDTQSPHQIECSEASNWGPH